MLHEGNIAEPAGVDRATYRRDAHRARWTSLPPARKPAGIGQPQAGSFKGTAVDVAGLPQPVDCAAVPGDSLHQSPWLARTFRAVGNFYGQAAVPVPSFVTVTNSSDVPPTCASAKAVDEVNIVSAVFDPTAQTLTVQATSSDKAEPTGPDSDRSARRRRRKRSSVGTSRHCRKGSYERYGAIALLTVRSSFGGTDTEKVVTNVGATPPPPTNQPPVAVNDSYTVAEDGVLISPPRRVCWSTTPTPRARRSRRYPVRVRRARPCRRRLLRLHPGRQLLRHGDLHLRRPSDDADWPTPTPRP